MRTHAWQVIGGTVLVGVALALPWTTFSAEPTTPTTTAVPSAHHPRRERYPEIHQAIKRLSKAKEDLQHAAHDFGGHRVKAIQAIDQALQELHEALAFDKA